MRETQLFEIGFTSKSLVITLPRSQHVISWAPVHGGLRTHARYILIHSIEPHITDAEMPAAIRRAASQARLFGTIVGMGSTGRISDYGIAEEAHDDLVAAAFCTASLLTLATAGEPGRNSDRMSSLGSRGAIHLVIAANYGMTHEAMLEAMGIATEAKVRTLHELGLRNDETGQLATGASMDCVAITSGHDRRYSSAGKSDRWGELIGEASTKALQIAIQKALVTAGKNTLSVSRAAQRELTGR